MALRYGQHYPVSYYSVWDQRTRTSWSWFSPELDITILGYRKPDDECAICTAVKRIILDCGESLGKDGFDNAGYTYILQFYFGGNLKMPNLETACISYKLNISSGVGVSFMTEFFSDDEVLLVDMEDTVQGRAVFHHETDIGILYLGSLVGTSTYLYRYSRLTQSICKATLPDDYIARMVPTICILPGLHDNEHTLKSSVIYNWDIQVLSLIEMSPRTDPMMSEKLSILTYSYDLDPAS